MKVSTLSLLVVFVFFQTAILAQNNENQKMDTVSYSLGLMVAKNLKKQGFEQVDAESLAKGIEDIMQGNDLVVGLNDANKLIQDHVKAMQAGKYEKNVAEGEKFLEENGLKEGVTTLPSGLQYEVLKEGDGPLPTPQDKVSIHYHGTLINGAIFDSSVDRGKPANFGVTQVIKGWTEALQLMKVGSKWRLYIPHDLAYGERSAGPTIEPYSTLIFEVELLGIE